MHTLNKASQLMPEVYLVFLSQFEDARGGDCILLLHLVHQGTQRKDMMPEQILWQCFYHHSLTAHVITARQTGSGS